MVTKASRAGAKAVARRAAVWAALGSTLLAGAATTSMIAAGSAQAATMSRTVTMRYAEIPSFHFQCKLTANEPHRVGSGGPVGRGSISCTGQDHTPLPYPLSLPITLRVKLYENGALVSTKTVHRTASRLSVQTSIACHNGTYRTHIYAKVRWGYHLGIADYGVAGLWSPSANISTCNAT